MTASIITHRQDFQSGWELVLVDNGATHFVPQDDGDEYHKPIYAGAKITKGQLLALVAGFFSRHSKTTFAALADQGC